MFLRGATNMTLLSELFRAELVLISWRGATNNDAPSGAVLGPHRGGMLVDVG